MHLLLTQQEIAEHTPRGYVIHQIDALLDGQPVGYIRISFLSKSLCYQLMPTAWHYMTLHQGWYCPIDNVVKLWKNAHLYAKRCPASRPDLTPWSISDEDIPDEETMLSDLAILEKPYWRGMRKKIRTHGNIPMVEYSKVDENYRRQGIGTQLYIAMAKFLAETYDFPLYASTLQSPEAEALWQGMRQKGLPIYRALIGGRKRYSLDFRTT
jgi:GNAT superfamily N-acetyltransferase